MLFLDFINALTHVQKQILRNAAGPGLAGLPDRLLVNLGGLVVATDINHPMFRPLLEAFKRNQPSLPTAGHDWEEEFHDLLKKRREEALWVQEHAKAETAQLKAYVDQQKKETEAHIERVVKAVARDAVKVYTAIAEELQPIAASAAQPQETPAQLSQEQKEALLQDNAKAVFIEKTGAAKVAERRAEVLAETLGLRALDVAGYRDATVARARETLVAGSQDTDFNRVDPRMIPDSVMDAQRTLLKLAAALNISMSASLRPTVISAQREEITQLSALARGLPGILAAMPAERLAPTDRMAQLVERLAGGLLAANAVLLDPRLGMSPSPTPRSKRSPLDPDTQYEKFMSPLSRRGRYGVDHLVDFPPGAYARRAPSPAPKAQFPDLLSPDSYADFLRGIQRPQPARAPRAR